MWDNFKKGADISFPALLYAGTIMPGLTGKTGKQDR
jgi:hypothetical protein